MSRILKVYEDFQAQELYQTVVFKELEIRGEVSAPGQSLYQYVSEHNIVVEAPRIRMPRSQLVRQQY